MELTAFMKLTAHIAYFPRESQWSWSIWRGSESVHISTEVYRLREEAERAAQNRMNENSKSRQKSESE